MEAVGRKNSCFLTQKRPYLGIEKLGNLPTSGRLNEYRKT